MEKAFLLHSFLLGAGLSMDAFTVSLADGLREPEMSGRRMRAIAGAYGAFQAVMPMTGRGLVRLAASRFLWLRRRIPFAGAALLFCVGGKMILESFLRPPGARSAPLDGAALLAQAFATSVDALSVGFAIAAYRLPQALLASAIIAAVTFFDCLAALAVGKRFGLLFSRQASVSGGLVLMGVGAETLFRALR
ncbi:MAG: manganese efflux pump [Oscillibacter sp.]|nr:manganese efflux pump [Oscillibacter sp.]